MQQRQKNASMEEQMATGTDNVLPLKRVRESGANVHTPLAVASIYIVGDGTPENPLQLNVPALTAAIVNSMTTANFLAIKNGIATCEGIRATGSSIGP
ncbi:hypothetical protein [Variovorax atrisoli]|uniref:hypothetical protein n=1 Tax=Variovorax atrisoli TaxID=3394203 RepID=UPI00403FD95F